MKKFIMIDNFIQQANGGIKNFPKPKEVEVVEVNFYKKNGLYGYDLLITTEGKFERSENYHPSSPYGWNKVEEDTE